MTRLRKTAAVLLIILCFSLLMVSCNDESDVHKIGGEAYLIKGVEMDTEHAFFDDFTNGIDPDNWYIGKQAWGAGVNGGVIPENVNYTDDGVLVITGNGKYYTDGDVAGVGSVKDGSLTGGALISRFVTGPGRYQVRMKVLPRQGACTAFWTYAYDTETQGNHEIDIELPGGMRSSTGISFQNVLNTNYTKVDENESSDSNLREVFDNKDFALNDGQWHTFGFDWYTNPKRVVYYIDGKVTATSSLSGTFVPYYTSRLWVGVWFPNTAGFVGDANFSSDCMYVDWVKYIPFKNQPVTQFNPVIASTGVANLDEYPTSPVSTANVNKVANGDFEYYLKNPTGVNGWTKGTRWLTNEEKVRLRAEFKAEIEAALPDGWTEQDVLDEVDRRIDAIEDSDDADLYVKIAAQQGYLDSCGVKICDIAQFSQEIDSVYGGFQMDVTFVATGKGKLNIVFYDSTSKISQTTVTVNKSDDWGKYSAYITAPKNCYKIKLEFSTEYGSEMYLDDVELRMVYQ